MKRSKPGGFTLIEVLVVVGIIALLVAILLPSLSKAKEQSIRVQCAGNFSNIGKAWHMYAHDMNDYFPPSWSGGAWRIVFDFLKPYFDNRKLNGDIFMCPTYEPHTCPNGLPCGWDNMTLTNANSVERPVLVTGYSFWTNIISDPYHPDPNRRWLPIREYTAQFISATGPGSWAEALVDGWSPDFRLPPWMNKVTDHTARVRKEYQSTEWVTRRFTPSDARIAWDEVFADENSYGQDGFHPEVTRHFRDGPTGANVLFGDGHLKWRPFKVMHEINMGGGYRQYY